MYIFHENDWCMTFAALGKDRPITSYPDIGGAATVSLLHGCFVNNTKNARQLSQQCWDTFLFVLKDAFLMFH